MPPSLQRHILEQGGSRSTLLLNQSPPPGRGRGRPSKKRKTQHALGDRSAHNAPVNMFEGEEQQAPPPVANVSFQIKKMRINWGKGKHRDLLVRAIQDWRKRMAENINNIKGCRECYKFTNSYGIPPQTFYKYIKPINPRILGDGSHGKKKWFTNDDVKFVGCVLACADQENDGLLSNEAVDMIQELQPDLTRVGAQRHIKLYILPVNSQLSVLKKCKQKVQATTSNRTNRNTAQQYCWHCAVDEAYDFMRTKNTGLCKLSGKSFGEVMPNLIVGLDKMCLMSNCHGNLQVFAAADKKKQEKLLQDCRCSITVMRTGTASGITGPTFSF
jgi:hypothetical protein